MRLEWSSNSVHKLISKFHFSKYLKHKLPLNLIKSLFCFKRQSNNQLSCSFSQVSVLNQHKKHQEPKSGFLIKSGLMRLQAGGSILSPEKYQSPPQIRKQAPEQGPVAARSISCQSKPSAVFSPLPLLPCSVPHWPPLFGSRFQCPLPPKTRSFGLFFPFSSLSQQFAPKSIKWDKALRGAQSWPLLDKEGVQEEAAQGGVSEPEPPRTVFPQGAACFGGGVWGGWAGQPCGRAARRKVSESRQRGRTFLHG